MESEMDGAPKENESFKAPSLPPSVDLPSKSNEEDKKAISKPENTIKKKQVNVPLPYQVPEWGGVPPFEFSFEVIKNGTLVTNIPLKTSFFVFGRLEVCDVVFEHPSVSRYHAIVQYCPGDELHPKGFYLYDLGSTHGTFLNKNQVKAKVYYKLKVGYVLKFGGSSRLYIFHGPEEDESEEQKPEIKAEPEGCNWGMDDDDDAEEEDINAVNPFALSTANEELYLDDPKKTLRGWFEREGYELEFKVEEKGYRSFSCTIQLPVDTPTGEYLPVDATVSGKKKEAVIACCLEACRTLDRLGLLRQSHQESRRERKRKKWEEDDYYDSEEDTFYDRTGEIEKRREMRKKLSAKKPAVENFETLKEKLNKLTSEIEEISKKLDACSKKGRGGDKSGDADSLESFMSSLAESANVPTDKFQRRKLMLRLSEAEKEKAHVEKLLNIARPAMLPSMSKYPGMVGKKPKSKLQAPIPKPKVKEDEKKDVIEDEKKDEVEEEEDESDSEKNSKSLNSNIKNKSPSPERMVIDDDEDSAKTKRYGLLIPGKDTETYRQDETLSTEKTKKNCEASITSPGADPSSEIVEDPKVLDDDDSSSSAPKPKSSKKSKSKNQADVDVYKKESAEYSTWTPPANQTGDGITHLNAKYGY